jgi:hypothetical protein
MAELVARIQEDIKTAMKAREKERVGVLRMLSAALKDAAIAKRSDLDEDEALKIVMSYGKKREEAIVEARKAGREDMATQEEAELAIVKTYLPEPLSDTALEEMVATAIAETGADSMKQMGQVMKLCTERAAGRADGSRISALVRAKLG